MYMIIQSFTGKCMQNCAGILLRYPLYIPKIMKWMNLFMVFTYTFWRTKDNSLNRILNTLVFALGWDCWIFANEKTPKMPSPSNVHLVSKQDYKSLERLLSAKLPQSGLIYNVLKLGQSLAKDAKISVQIFADEAEDRWSENTTTFMGVTNVKGLPQNLVVLCGPKNGPSKDAVLRLVSVLDWKRENQFEGVETSVAPVLIAEAKKHGKLIEHDTIGLYYMSPTEALSIFTEKDLDALSNPNIRGTSLEAEDAAIVEDRWPEKHEGYYEMLQASIELCSSGGVYLAKDTADDMNEKSSWELVSFAVALPFGSIHAFHTEPDYRRKGYGKIAMKVLARNIAKAGCVPLVQIYKMNDGSKSLNESIGFKYSHDINLINFIPN